MLEPGTSLHSIEVSLTIVDVGGDIYDFHILLNVADSSIERVAGDTHVVELGVVFCAAVCSFIILRNFVASLNHNNRACFFLQIVIIGLLWLLQGVPSWFSRIHVGVFLAGSFRNGENDSTVSILKVGAGCEDANVVYVICLKLRSIWLFSSLSHWGLLAVPNSCCVHGLVEVVLPGHVE